MNRSADASSSDATTTPAPATPPSPLVSSAAPAASALTPAPASGKWLRRLAWVMGGVAVLVAVSWVLVPPLLKSQLEKLASAQLGRALTVGKIDFKPWNLQLFVDDLTIAKADGSGPQLQIRRVFVDASLQSIRRLAPVVDAIAVDGLHLNLTHLGGGQYDVDDIIAKLNQPSDKPKADAAPPGFALYNLALNGASMDFNDQAVGKTHTLRALNLGVPFLSNLPGSRAVKTEPRLAFQVNGSAFDSRVSSTPFTESHKTDASIRISAFDLQPYLAYLPANLPAELTSAVLDADVKVAFEQTSHTAVRLSGTVGAKNLVVKEKPVRPVVQAVKRDPVPDLFAFEALRLAFDDVRPLERVARLSLLELTAPKLAVARNRSGHVNLAFNREKAGKQFEKQAKNALDSGSVRADSANLKAKKDDASTAWKVELAKMQLSNGQIRWQDATTLPAAQVALDDLSLEATAITWPFAQPLQFVGSAGISGAAARLEFSGFATDQAADVKVSLSDLPLAIASPYLAQFLQPRLVGQLAAEAAVQWTPASLKIHAGRLTVTDVALLSPAVGKKGADVTGSVKSASSSRSGKSTGAAPLDALASLKKLEVIDTLVDLGRQSVAIGKVSLLQPQIAVERNAERHWMAESWLKSGADKSDSRPWAVTVADIALDGGAFHFVDKAPSRPVALEVSNLKLGLKAFELNGKKPMPVTVMFRIRQPQGELGQLDYKGNLGLEPLSADGDLLATQIPVHAFEPYFGQALNVEVLRGEAGFKGRVKFSGSPAGPSVQVKGDAVLEEFRTRAPVAAEEMLSWKALSVRGLDVAMVPGTAVTVSVAETALTDFFARVLVNEGGRINLQDLIKSSAVPESPDAAKSAAFGSNPERAPDRNELPAVVNIGPVSLINGKVFFSDHFIRPNYSANLSELNGRLSAFSNTPGAVSAAPQMADLELRGRAEGTASLEILGKLNPLAKPLALDLKAKVRDLELPPLSPYSVKYAGHGIERGKLSVDLAYAVKPDGQLEASNNIILNQLKFGEKVEGAFNSLPVKLAVALLADRNGVIDINLPVSGSLNDPQFSLGSIIFKVIINLVVKAVLSPFSLLASVLGGDGDELSQVSFAAGSAVLGAEAKAGLDKVAKALADRPALKMTVVGTSNLDVEREAYKQEQLAALLQIEKRRVQVVGGSAGAAAPAAVASPAAAISAADRPALIREVYRRSDMPKPRNLIGIAKDIPVEEMEALLLANFAVTDDVMRDLALQRGVAVKDYLASKQLPLERLFLGNARAGEPAVKAGEPADTKAEAKSAAKWTPRAELNLATN